MGNNTSKLDIIKASSFLTTLAGLVTVFRNRDRIRAALVQTLTRLFYTINENPYLQTIAIPSGLGFFMYLSRTIWYYLYNQIRLWLYCSVSISSKDRNFNAVVDFVSKLHEEHNTLIEAETKKVKFTRKSWIRMWNGIGERKPPEMEYKPKKNSSMSTFFYKNHRILMWRSAGRIITTGYDRQPMELEKLTLATWAGNVELLKDLLKEALAATFEEESDETKVFILSSSSWLGGWEQALTKERRPKGSIVLDGTTSERIIKDARDFLRDRAWYMNRGIPHRRGYLLHGPPGCGKTSFVQVLAGVLKLDLCMLSLSSSRLTDEKLAANFRDAPESSIILLEDVDAVFVDREVKKDPGSRGTGVSFSGLLNAIDGVASQEGRLFFMTSNFPEKLDPALVRPGRCDVKIELRCASRNQMRRLFLRFFANRNDLAENFAASLPEFELSMAQLQGHLLQYRFSAEDAVQAVPLLLNSVKPKSVKKMSVYDHLRRVGLERLAALFEMHGFAHVNDLRGLTVDVVKQWDVELCYDTLQAERLGRLLKEDEVLMKNDYPLASISGIRQAFFAAYPISRMKHLSLTAPDPHRTRIQRQNSIDQAYDSKMKASASIESADGGGEIAQRLEDLAKELSEKLSYFSTIEDQDESKIVRGRGRVSLWQLRWLLTQNADPEMAVRNADALLAERTYAERTPQFMSSFEWLSRAGHADLWYKFEDEEIMLASDIMRMSKSDFKDLKISESVAKRLVRLCKMGNDARNDTCGLLRPNRSAIVRAFRLAYPDCTYEQMSEFARVTTNRYGRGLCSKIQLEAYLYNDDEDEEKSSSAPSSTSEQKEPDISFFKERMPRFPSATEAVAAARETLLASFERCARPAKKKPRRNTSWVYKMLKHADKSLADNASAFVKAGLKEAEDVLAKPLLTLEDLETMGIKKLGHRRKIVRLLKSISEGADDGVLKKGDKIRSKFGEGCVKSHRDKDDMYEIDLSWGKMFALEENDKIKRILPKPEQTTAEGKTSENREVENTENLEVENTE